MRITALVSTLLVAMTGCVSVANPQNYRPANGERASEYYQCYQNAHQPQAFSSVYYSEARMKLNNDMLEHCMDARGYRLRKPNAVEHVMGWLFLPVWLPLSILGGGTGSLKIGGGPAED